MDANDLANAIALRSSVPRSQVDRVLCAFQEVVLDTLRRNEDVSVSGFGVWNRPVRHESTPDFAFVVPTGPLYAEPPSRFHEECEQQGNVRGIADYLLLHPVLEETFGADQDHFPGLEETLHPGIVTREEVHAMAFSGLRCTFSPEEVGARIVRNLSVRARA